MIDRRNWQWFRVGDLFPPQKCKCSNATELLEDGDEIAYIGAKKSDNGVMRYVKRVENLVSRGNCIVFIGDGQGSVGYSLYQPVDFIGSTTLIVGYNEHLNPYNAAFLVSVLDLERFRYSFGRKYKKGVVANTKIQLPAIKLDNGDYTPDWKYMEDFVKDQIIPQLPKKAQKVWLKKYDTQPQCHQRLALNTDKWQCFFVEDLFKLEPTKGTTTDELTEGTEIPYIAAKHDNNGCEMMCSEEDNAQFISKGNCIVFICLGAGSAGYALYQGGDFIGMSGKTMSGYNPNLNQYNGLFLASILSKERPKYSFGRSWTGERLKKTKIKLPVTPEGTPDWQFMEDYIKSLPYSKNIEPSDPNEIVDELMEVKKEMIKLRHQLQAHNPQELQIVGGNVTINDYSTTYNVKK